MKNKLAVSFITEKKPYEIIKHYEKNNKVYTIIDFYYKTKPTEKTEFDENGKPIKKQGFNTIAIRKGIPKLLSKKDHKEIMELRKKIKFEMKNIYNTNLED